MTPTGSPHGRTRVLAAIRDAVATIPNADRPHEAPVATAHTSPSAAAIADPVGTFIASARAVGTEVHTTTPANRDATVERLIDEAVADLVRPNGQVRVERFPDGNEAAPFDIDVAVVPATLGIVTLGSVLLEGPRLAPMTAEITIAVLDVKTLVPTLHDALITHRPGPTRLFVTGPSKTADIEGVLVTGVHGPRRFIVVLVA